MAKFLSLVIISFLVQLSPSSSTTTGTRVQLAHVDLQLNLTMPELSLRGVERTKQSISSIASIASSLINTLVAAATGNLLARVHRARFTYQINIGIGTPPVPISVIADTGSDLIWTQCAPCRCFPQPGAIYAPSNSTSFSKQINCSSQLCQSLGNERTCGGNVCNYHYAYADNSFTKGFLASETFTFGSTVVPGIGFGCGRTNDLSNTDSSAGVVGLGRGALSLVSQLGARKFSYCLTKYGESTTSPLLLGSLAVLSGAAQSTPFVRTPARLSSLYYLSLEGISVGSKRLTIPSSVFELKSDGSGGTIIDSGSAFTVLERRAFEALKREFHSQLGMPEADGSLVHLDLCFSVQSAGKETPVPKLVFHFDGADMDIPTENYMIPLVDIGMACLAILDSDSGLSILGGFQQQNMHILYDLEGNKLSFSKARCDRL